MKLVPVNKKLALLIILSAVLVGAAGPFVYPYFDKGVPGSEKYITNALNDSETKKNLEEGNCSENTTSRLDSINESSNPAIVAQAYETRGMCQVYADNLESAKTSYGKAAEFYEKAGNTEQAAVLRSIVTGIEGSLAGDREPEDSPTEDTPEDAVYEQ